MEVLIDKLIKLTMQGGDSVWVSVDCIDIMYRTAATIPYTRIITTHEELHEEFFVKETPEEIEKMWTVMQHES